MSHNPRLSVRTALAGLAERNARRSEKRKRLRVPLNPRGNVTAIRTTGRREQLAAAIRWAMERAA